VFCYTSRLKNRKKNDLLDAYEGCACSMSGAQIELYYRNDTTIVFFFAATAIKERVAERGRPCFFAAKLKA